MSEKPSKNLRDSASPREKTDARAAPLMPTRASAYSDGLASALKKAGRNFTDRDIADLLVHTENRRQDWICAAIQLGIALLAKKEALGHGKFTPWLAKLAQAYSQRAANMEGGSKRIFEQHMYLARRYLCALDAGPRLDGRHTLHLAVQEHGKLAAAVATLPALANDAAKLTPSIAAFVAGRSLRQLLTDLREAERDADEAEAEERTLHDADTGKPVKDAGGTAPAKPEQMEFDLDKIWYADVAPAIEENFKTVAAAAAKLPGEKVQHYWESVARDLREKAELAADYAKAARTSASRSQEQTAALNEIA